MIKIFHGYLIKRSFLISLSIFILFATLDLVFSLMSELENLSEEYNFSNVFLYVLSVSPSNAINFLEGACLLGVMISAILVIYQLFQIQIQPLMNSAVAPPDLRLCLPY